MSVKHEDRVLGYLNSHFIPTPGALEKDLYVASNEIKAKLVINWQNAVDFLLVENRFTLSISDESTLLNDLVYTSGTTDFTAEFVSFASGLKNARIHNIIINDTGLIFVSMILKCYKDVKFSS